MRAFFVILLGAIAGAVSTALLGPKIIIYWFASPVRVACDCTPAITWALDRLNWMQLVFTVIGAALFFVLDRAFLHRKKGPPPVTG